jgi:hypothetical protein
MASRSGWLLLGIAVGCASLPSCTPLRYVPIQDDYAADQITLPPEPVPVQPSQRVAKIIEPAELANAAVEAKTKPLDAKSEPVEAGTKAAPPKTDRVKRAPLVAALESILDDRHQDALGHLAAYDAETQEFYLRILPTLTIFAKKHLNELTSEEVAVLNDQLQSLLAKLRPKTELLIDRMCCCEWVKAFGIFQPLEETRAFVGPTADRPGELVQLYVEVRNFASMPRGGCFETRLASTIEIRDAKGEKVHALDFKDGKDALKSLTRLNDYYNTYSFPVPNLPPGTYQLTLQIADETVPGARRIARKSIDFRITPLSARGP